MMNVTKDPKQAAEWINQGKLLAYPTESVWGIGCNPYDEVAVKKILAIKLRPLEKGMIVVTDRVDRIQSLLANLPTSKRQQVAQSWEDKNSNTESLNHINNYQQAHTWVLPLATDDSATNLSRPIPKWITGRYDSVAVRVIAHPLIQALCQRLVSDNNAFGFLVSTSCNPSQLSPATTFDEAFAYFANDIYYLQGETLGYTLPSQIKDALSGKALR